MPVEFEFYFPDDNLKNQCIENDVQKKSPSQNIGRVNGAKQLKIGFEN